MHLDSVQIVLEMILQSYAIVVPTVIENIIVFLKSFGKVLLPLCANFQFGIRDRYFPKF